jgi:PmbA protein
VRVEAARGARRVEAEFVARSAADFKPLALACRVADRFVALAEGELPPPGALLLAPAVAARLVEALAPRLVGRAAAERWAAGERLGAGAVTLVDDGGRADGLLAAPCDGEGVPTRATTLVERGRFVQPLLAWWEADSPARAAGCSRRHGWRDLPRRGPSELFLAPDPQVAVPDLLAELGRGAYLIACEGGVRTEGDAFSVAVSGFAIAGGRAVGGLGPCRLSGHLTGWLAAVSAVARDLQFVPGEALFGAPTVRVAGDALTLAPLPRQ